MTETTTPYNQDQSTPKSKRKYKDTKDFMLRVRMHPSELKQLDKLASEASKSRSEVVRDLIIKGKVQDAEIRRQELINARQKLTLISRANANLNMIAKWANTYKENAYTVEVVAHLIAVERELIEVLNEVR